MLKFAVDSSLCQGHGNCAATAPDLVRLDDQGYAEGSPVADVPADLEDAALRAEDYCPAFAVRISEGDDNFS